MNGLEILGLIMLMLSGMSALPRTVGSIVIGVLIGGSWWWLFGPLAVIGFCLDCYFAHFLDS